MDGLEDKKVAIGDLDSFIVVGDAKGEFNAFFDERIGGFVALRSR